MKATKREYFARAGPVWKYFAGVDCTVDRKELIQVTKSHSTIDVVLQRSRACRCCGAFWNRSGVAVQYASFTPSWSMPKVYQARRNGCYCLTATSGDLNAVQFCSIGETRATEIPSLGRNEGRNASPGSTHSREHCVDDWYRRYLVDILCRTDLKTSTECFRMVIHPQIQRVMDKGSLSRSSLLFSAFRSYNTKPALPPLSIISSP